MEIVKYLLDFFLHLDDKLGEIILQYGTVTYLILFAIIFTETGLVIMPFLPGDSLLFAAGSFAGKGSLDVWVLFVSLSVAAIIGDTVNYWIGNKLGEPAYQGKIKFIKKEHITRTHEFFEKHGGKTIVLARFVPIVRTFAPFVAGASKMSYKYFITYNIFGGILWVAIFVFAGYFFGTIPFVQENFELVIVAILVLSVVPMIYEWIKARQEKSSIQKQPDVSAE
jgi:membrane-associated protein